MSRDCGGCGQVVNVHEISSLYTQYAMVVFVLAVSQLETRDPLWRVSWSLRRTPQGVSSTSYHLALLSLLFLSTISVLFPLFHLSLSIAEGLRHKCLEHLGSPMVYELVEYAKDCLTDNNRPCGQCAICQFDFEVYMKPHTCTYTYIHTHTW